MSITRHHIEWLSLVPNSGPFLSLPVLAQAFPQGLDAHDADHARRLRMAFVEWDDNQTGKRPDPGIHQTWIKLVLAETLGYDELLAEKQEIPQTLKSELAEYGVTLKPDWIVNDPATKKVRLLVQIYPRSQSLTKPVPSSRWHTSPDTRMMQLLHDTDIRLGIVTNGDHWMLVNAPKNETTGYASWYANLWLEEPVTQRAFRTLLCADRLFSVPDNETLQALLDKSADDQQEVTDQLGYQVRKAVEVLIQSLDKADQDHGRKLLAEVDERLLYESALTVMMRLVFLFCAEERELLLLGDDLYDKNYAVSTLREQLRVTADQFGEEILGLRYDAWIRLLTSFRIVYAGARHHRLQLPAYGGRLFDPDRFPFLEGRKTTNNTNPTNNDKTNPSSDSFDSCYSWLNTPANPLPVSNRTVLHLLEALQVLQVRLPGGGAAEARKLSFRALDIEQIGHVYEGLLDHTVRRATEQVLGLTGTRDKEPEIALAELEKLAAKGEKELLKFLKDESGRSESALKKGLKAELDDQLVSRFRTACQDSDLWKRVQPFAGLVRLDTVSYPVVITTGSVFVTAGTDRRSSGTHYTPKSLTEPIVQYTLEPLVYVGPAEGLPKDQWKLRPAKELLALKICDMACGSGAFLVQACRYLAARLLEAWDDSEKMAQVGHQDTLFDKQARTALLVRITPYGMASQGGLYEQLVPIDPDERQTYALRIVAQRCLYGVDKNHLAVEMAKLSLWLLTLAKSMPFEFLDHAIRCGDSLVGIHKLDQLRMFNLNGVGEYNNLFLQFLDPKIKEAIDLRRQITELQANTVEDVEQQNLMLGEANEKIDRLKCAADLLIAAEFMPGSAADKRAARDDAAITVAIHSYESDLPTFRREVQKALAGQETFHWPLEYPEVMVERGGFDAVVGNPPWGQKVIDTTAPLRGFIQRQFQSSRGIFDFFRPFVERCTQLIQTGGVLGLVLPDILLLKNYPATRKFLLDHVEIRHLTWHAMPFAGAVIDAVTIDGLVRIPRDDSVIAVSRHERRESLQTSVSQSDFDRPPAYEFNLHVNNGQRATLDVFTSYPNLGSFFEVHEGVHSGNIRAELFVGNRIDDSCRELYFGREEIRPHRLVWAGRFIHLSAIPEQRTKERYANAGRPEWYARPKVLVRRTGDYVLASADESGRYASNNFFVVFPSTPCSLNVFGMAALLNSHFMTWYYRSMVPRKGRAFAELKIRHLSTFPLPREVLLQNGCQALNDLGRRRSNADGEEAKRLDQMIDQLVDSQFGITYWSDKGEPQ